MPGNLILRGGIRGDSGRYNDRFFQERVVGQELRPMLVKRGPVARLEGDHRHGYGIALVFEKERQVVRFDFA